MYELILVHILNPYSTPVFYPLILPPPLAPLFYPAAYIIAIIFLDVEL